ncbi:DUF1127 domain-containing protein [Histidinibacterium aquaticum]|uniref:DUF1127 domain-containing protein n=1 Tax=Histidinibacterium aquaticum TaxID=2613962 RepID=A0A5J5GPH8_9RHOB|nr:DUF1127 domain-containing protein [Histidinibacterium aquaticum]KAA9010201.1 DUF1127 domain-containing protein [Histidinibacterium aquaticum]
MTTMTRTLAVTGSRRRAAGLLDLLGLYRQRRALARLDASGLRDIGVSASDAAREAARPVWDVPAGWRC